MQPCLTWAIKLIAHPKITPIISFHCDFLQKGQSAHPEILFAHLELPFLDKSMTQCNTVMTNKIKILKRNWRKLWKTWKLHFDGILQKGPYPPCLRMADRALLAGYPRFYSITYFSSSVMSALNFLFWSSLCISSSSFLLLVLLIVFNKPLALKQNTTRCNDCVGSNQWMQTHWQGANQLTEHKINWQLN